MTGHAPLSVSGFEAWLSSSYIRITGLDSGESVEIMRGVTQTTLLTTYTLTVAGDGTLTFDGGGTLVTSAAGAFPLDEWVHVQFRYLCRATTAGNVGVRVNDVLALGTDDASATGYRTNQQASGNATGYYLGAVSGTGSDVTVDIDDRVIGLPNSYPYVLAGRPPPLVPEWQNQLWVENLPLTGSGTFLLVRQSDPTLGDLSLNGAATPLDCIDDSPPHDNDGTYLRSPQSTTGLALYRSFTKTGMTSTTTSLVPLECISGVQTVSAAAREGTGPGDLSFGIQVNTQFRTQSGMLHTGFMLNPRAGGSEDYTQPTYGYFVQALSFPPDADDKVSLDDARRHITEAEANALQVLPFEREGTGSIGFEATRWSFITCEIAHIACEPTPCPGGVNTWVGWIGEV